MAEEREEGRPRRGPSRLLVVALAAYLCLGGFAVQDRLPKRITNYDSVNYEAMTKQWLRTGVYGYYGKGRQDAVVPFGYPAFLAPFYYYGGRTEDGRGGPYSAIYIAQLLVGAAGLVFTWLFANAVAGRRAADVAVLLLALMASYNGQAAWLLTSLLASTLFMAYLWVLSLALRRGGTKTGAALSVAGGVLLGASLLTRPTMAVAGLVPLALGLSTTMRPRLRSSLLAGFGLVLGVAPWLVRNAVVLHSLSPIARRDETVLQGIDPYFRAKDWRAFGGPSGAEYSRLSIEGRATMTKTAFSWTKVREAWARNPWEVVGWFSVGKLQYIAFTSLPAADNLGATDAILRSFLGAVGLLGAVLSVRMRDLLPTAAMLAAWLVLTLLIVPDTRYWFDVYPLLATLSGAVVSALLEVKAPEPAPAEEG